MANLKSKPLWHRFYGPLAAIFCALAFFQTAAGQARFRVMFDPGHSYTKPGSISCHGDNETKYNDQVVQTLLEAQWPQIEVATTRAPGKNFERAILEQSGLDELRLRPFLAQQQESQLFISIHHDSTQKVYLDKTAKKGFVLNSQFHSRHTSGFSIFVSTVNPRYEDSLRFAKLVGQRLVQMGRVPSTHHHEDIPNEGYQYIVPELGIYNSRLLVLRETRMPAILIELGLLGDCEDLALISSPQFRRQFADAIKSAIQEFVATSR